MGRKGFQKSGWVQIVECLAEKLCLFQTITGAINSCDWIQQQQLQGEEGSQEKPANPLASWWQYQA